MMSSRSLLTTLLCAALLLASACKTNKATPDPDPVVEKPQPDAKETEEKTPEPPDITPSVLQARGGIEGALLVATRAATARAEELAMLPARVTNLDIIVRAWKLLDEGGYLTAFPTRA